MKTASFLFVIFLSANSLFAQETSSRIFSLFETGLYGGINFSTLSNSGTSFLLEGKTNLSSNLNAKLSIGYSKSYLLDSYQVKSYSSTSIQNVQKYQTRSYDVNKTRYSIIPITLGLEYIFHHDIFSPYFLQRQVIIIIIQQFIHQLGLPGIMIHMIRYLLSIKINKRALLKVVHIGQVQEQVQSIIYYQQLIWMLDIYTNSTK